MGQRGVPELVQGERPAGHAGGVFLEQLGRPAIGQPRLAGGSIDVGQRDGGTGCSVGEKYRPTPAPGQQAGQQPRGPGLPHDHVAGTAFAGDHRASVGGVRSVTSSDKASSARAALSYINVHNTRSRKGAAVARISSIWGRVRARMRSVGIGRVRNRTSGSPVSQPWSRQYEQAAPSAVNRVLNVLASRLPHTELNHAASWSGSRAATALSAPKSATSRLHA